MSGTGIFNWSNSAANTYLPRKTFSFEHSTYPNKARGAGRRSWHSHRVGKNNTLGLLSFDVVGSSHLEVVSGSACVADQQVHSLRSTWAAFWCQSQRKRNTRGWTGVLGFFLFPNTSSQIPVSKGMLPTTREVPLPPPRVAFGEEQVVLWVFLY